MFNAGGNGIEPAASRFWRLVGASSSFLDQMQMEALRIGLSSRTKTKLHSRCKEGRSLAQISSGESKDNFLSHVPGCDRLTFIFPEKEKPSFCSLVKG